MTYSIKNRGDKTEVLLYEDIGDSWWGGVTAKQFKEDIAAIKGVINVRINSPGGSVHDGFAIANALREHPSSVEIDVDALAASIASYIVVASGADTVRMADNAMLMIHNAWSVAMGDAHEMRRQADILDKHNEQIVAAYAEKVGGDIGKVREWMDAETWFNADEAREAGLVDAVVEEAKMAAQWFDPDRFRNTPAQLKAMMARQPREKPEALKREYYRRQIQLTKTTG